MGWITGRGEVGGGKRLGSGKRRGTEVGDVTYEGVKRTLNNTHMKSKFTVISKLGTE